MYKLPWIYGHVTTCSSQQILGADWWQKTVHIVKERGIQDKNVGDSTKLKMTYSVTSVESQVTWRKIVEAGITRIELINPTHIVIIVEDRTTQYKNVEVGAMQTYSASTASLKAMQ